MLCNTVLPREYVNKNRYEWVPLIDNSVKWGKVSTFRLKMQIFGGKPARKSRLRTANNCWRVISHLPGRCLWLARGIFDAKIQRWPMWRFSPSWCACIRSQHAQVGPEPFGSAGLAQDWIDDIAKIKTNTTVYIPLWYVRARQGSLSFRNNVLQKKLYLSMYWCYWEKRLNLINRNVTHTKRCNNIFKRKLVYNLTYKLTHSIVLIIIVLR